MKEFIKTTLAVMCGVFLMNIVGFILFFMFIGSMAAAGESKPVLPRSGVLKIDMSELVVAEQASADIDVNALIGGSGMQSLGLWNVVQAINAAAIDPSVKYIYIKTDGIMSDFSVTEEIRKALVNFRQSGKAIISYIESPDTQSYYLASVADKVFMSSNAGASPMIMGVSNQMIFLKDLLDKLGVNVQLIRHGKYKSAGEMYIKNSPSPENLEQNQVMINSIWASIAEDIAESRGITPEALSDMIDNLELNDADDMINNSLVDEIVDRSTLKERLADLAVAENFKDVSMISFADYVKVKGVSNATAKQKIAVVYAEGSIIEGDGTSDVAGDRFAAELSKIREDEQVKAVVLRVSSPGGSVLASDKIKSEIDKLREVKPVIASYGAYAASGGYWISASCDKIFTDETTLTGSIGCFSMIPDLSKTAKDLLHIGITTVGSSKHAGMLSAMRPLDESEVAYMQESIETIYSQFLTVVSEGRDLTPEYVDSIAQGRVWTGSDALAIGLVDSIGTLEDAVKYAAMVASDGNPDLSVWNVESYPKPLTLMENLLSSMGQSLDKGNDVFAGTPFESVENAFKNWSWEDSEHIYARMPFEMVIK